MLGLKRGTVALFPHETEWKVEAQRTIEKLKNICGDAIVDIAHVGSTSVKNIMAKPIVDIAVETENFDKFLEYIFADQRQRLLFQVRRLVVEV